jgi:hypothetical protein
MSAADLFKQAHERHWLDEKGNSHPYNLLPPATAAQLSDATKTAERELPAELAALLAFSTGIAEFTPPVESVDFTGALEFESRDLFPHGLPIAADGFGNFWVLDIVPGDDACVFFACHDPPVIVVQSSSLSEFIQQLLAHGSNPADSEIGKIHDTLSGQIWSDNPGVMSRQQALDGDESLRAFASDLDDSYLFIDLRKTLTGQGLSWGRYGAGTIVKRHGLERLFAYQQRKLSWLQKIFGV